jgi:hypothetical protein
MTTTIHLMTARSRARLLLGSRLASAAALAVAALLAAPAVSSAAGFSSQDFDGDGVANTGDNCLVVSNPDQRRQPGSDTGEACTGDNAQATVDALRFKFDQSQMDQIFRFLRAGPMPGWEARCKGYAIWSADSGSDDDEANSWTDMLWQGKTFYTGTNGGYVWNRWGSRNTVAVRGDVYYGDSIVDGGRVINIRYNGGERKGFDEVRTVQAGIQLGYGYFEKPDAAPRRVVNFVFDFVHPS